MYILYWNSEIWKIESCSMKANGKDSNLRKSNETISRKEGEMSVVTGRILHRWSKQLLRLLNYISAFLQYCLVYYMTKQIICIWQHRWCLYSWMCSSISHSLGVRFYIQFSINRKLLRHSPTLVKGTFQEVKILFNFKAKGFIPL